MPRPLIVNATAIGHRVDGIAVYGIHLVKALWTAVGDRAMTIVLNEEARRFFPDSEIPPGVSIRWMSARMSPSHGTRGNLRRWRFANRLAWRHPGALVFGLSQLEAPIAGRPGVVMVHDMIPWLFRDAHPRQSYYYRFYLGRALRHALAVITPSCATKDDVCRCYGIDAGRVHVVRHGTPVPAAAPAARRSRTDPYILCIARPDPAKNLAALFAAFQMIEPRLGVRLVVAGEGTDLATGLEDGTGRIVIRGTVSEAEKIALLDGASMLVCPSLYEGFGFAPIEAMARGCPVVAADVGALPEVCGDAAIYVDPRQPLEIADAMRRVLTSPAFGGELAQRGRGRVNGLTWGASARAHLAVFDLDEPQRSAGADQQRDRRIRAGARS
jgi:glycosyltransferase involved in cell wall biosynthesis